MTITNIIFDWGGVLTIHKHSDNVIKLLEKEFDAKIRGKKPAFGVFTDRLDRDSATFSEFVQQVNQAYKINVSVKQMKDVFQRAAVLNRKLLPVIRKLGKNYKIIMLSNNNKTVVAHLKKKQNKMLKLFDKLFFSCEMQGGIAKPDEKIYVKTLKKLRVSASECLFIDDVKPNVVAAKKLGINAIQYKSNVQLKKELKKYGIAI
ncbi:MAG: HAD family phosphatase [Candidatus Micrarchaeota archaeon]|nr:HAD family phosphatase [Candidatus Micrarchaeota archaeon]